VTAAGAHVAVERRPRLASRHPERRRRRTAGERRAAISTSAWCTGSRSS